MGKRDQLICKTPASCFEKWWRDGLPCGNGETGLLVHGSIEEETILINHSSLWHWGKNSSVPEAGDALKITRELIDQGKYQEANQVTSRALLDQGYDSMLFTPCPLADLKITLHDCSPFSDYSRVLFMDKAEVETGWRFRDAAFKRNCFVSRKNDLFVFQQTCTNKIASGKIMLGLHESYGSDTVRMREECKESLTIECKDGYLYYAFTNDDGKDCGIVLRAEGDGKLSCEADGSISYMGMKKLLLIGKVFVGTEREKAFGDIRILLEAMEPHYDAQLKEHVILHKNKYKSCELELSNKDFSLSNERLLLDAYEKTPSNTMLEKLWRYGRYLFICSTKEDGLPMPLYGLWHGEYDAVWSHNMANINIQMIYWHSFTGNLLEMNQAFIDYYYGLMDQFKENARQLFGMEGIYLSAGSTPGFGRINQVVPVITNWIAAGGWVAAHFYRYYLYTGDKTYLKEKIVPFMLEAAKFYLDYLVFSPDGKLRCYPSVSPENTPGNLMPDCFVEFMDHACPTSENALMDFAIIKELFRNILALSRETEIDDAILTKCRLYLNAMPEYQYNADGSVKEWLKEELEDNHFHRHISHLYPVFPGEEVDISEQQELADAFLKSVDRRELGGQTGWSFCHTACVLTRLQQPEKAMEFMEIMTRSTLTSSFFTLHNDWRKMGMSLNLDNFAPIQLDANLGYVQVLQMMFLDYTEGIARILPAQPERFAKGKVKNFVMPEGEISFAWSLNDITMSLMIKPGASFKMVLPSKYHEYQFKCSKHLEVIQNKDYVEICNHTSSQKHIRITGLYKK